MADSSSSTSQNPPIEKVGLGFLLQDTPPIKPAIHQPEITPDEGSDTPPSAVATLDEETEFLNAIERDLRELTIQQAHIESIDEEKWDDVGTQKDSDENEIDEGDEDKEGDEAINYSDGASKLGGYNQNNSRRRVNYPMRPDAEDCPYYMKFGSCKFGLNCKFNHPPRRKNQVYFA